MGGNLPLKKKEEAKAWQKITDLNSQSWCIQADGKRLRAMNAAQFAFARACLRQWLSHLKAFRTERGGNLASHRCWCAGTRSCREPAWPRLISSWQRGLTGQWAWNQISPDARVKYDPTFCLLPHRISFSLAHLYTAAGLCRGTGTRAT